MDFLLKNSMWSGNLICCSQCQYCKVKVEQFRNSIPVAALVVFDEKEVKEYCSWKALALPLPPASPKFSFKDRLHIKLDSNFPHSATLGCHELLYLLHRILTKICTVSGGFFTSLRKQGKQTYHKKKLSKSTS